MFLGIDQYRGVTWGIHKVTGLLTKYSQVFM